MNSRTPEPQDASRPTGASVMNSQAADPAPLRDPERGQPNVVEHSRASIINSQTAEHLALKRRAWAAS